MPIARRALPFFLFCLAAAPLPMLAQQLLGSIAGTVTDSSGAIIPGAAINVKNLETNLQVKVTSFANGSYLAPNLPSGTYSVALSKDGFKTENHTSITVEANRTATVNGRLEVGAVATTVDVVATPLLNQSDTTTGYVMDKDAIENTPLATGSLTQLAILSPGVSADFLSSTGTNAGLGNQAIWANGQRDTSNSFSINGVAANNLFNGKSTSTVASTRFTANTGSFPSASFPGDNVTGTSVYTSIGNSLPTPSPEMLQELRVNTAMYDASQGAKSGAQITAITRSGTNHFHGQLYEHFQNSFLNAAPFFRNASPTIPANLKRIPLKSNRFGATIGGPIVKDKLFFFFAYQGMRNADTQSGSQFVTVPNHLTDDRSAAALVNIALLDYGKTISASQIDPAAAKLLNFKLPNGQYLIPSAQTTDPAALAIQRSDVYLQGAASFQQNMEAASVDYNISSQDRLTLKLLSSYNPTSSALSSGSSTLGFPQENQAGSQSAVLDNTTILSPTLTWEQKVGYVRMSSFVKNQQPLSPPDVGINIFNNNTNWAGISIAQGDALNSNLRGTFRVGPNSTFAGGAGTYQNQFEFNTSVNWVHGRHTVYVGASLDRNQLNIVNNANNVAAIGFNTFTDFLTGTILPSGTNYTLGASNRYFRASLIGGFLQDNIKLKSNLTVSLGLRYDDNGPLWEKYGLLTNFHPDLYHFDNATGTVTSTGLVVAGNNKTLGTAGVDNSTLTGRQWGVGPRIGVVWSPNQLRNVVIRTGFGMFYDRGEYFSEFSPGAGANGVSGPFGITLAPPFVQKVNGVAGGTLSVPFTGAVLPAAVTTQTLFAGLFPTLANLKNGSTPYIFGGYDPANTSPYTENWTFDVQWQPTNSLQLSVGYVGNRSLHQVIPIPFNQPQIATPSNPINGEIYSYGWNIVPAESLKTFNGGNTDIRTPYLSMDSNSVFYRAEGIATYNALQVGLRKRLSKGLQLSASYTWSHTLDEQSGLGLFFNGNDPTNLRSAYGTSTYDRTHVATVQYFYQIPGLGSDHSVLGRVTKGWALNGIVVAQSGLPYNAYDFSGAVGSIYYSQFVNIIDPVLPLKPGVTVQQATLQGTTGFDINKPFLDPNAFAVPTIAAGTGGVPPCSTNAAGAQLCDNSETSFGATARNTFRGPFQWRADVSAQKQTKLTEKLALKIQADFFNFANHPSFDVPSVSGGLYTVSTTGGNRVPTQRSFLSTFAESRGTIGSPRIVMFSANLIF